MFIFMGSKWKNGQERVTRIDHRRWILIANFSTSLTLQSCKLSYSKVTYLVSTLSIKNAATSQTSPLPS